ncbi:23S rRNA (adenine(2030)-N(6))-methyltransferase RlmJ [Chenggangzhangella methanolivorans]|uniref:Ribosomal RNA large subunit methyltransferase J n=1 Tax=Chenggangzhangella methanolivorans TaxID=1437009 RepID=A0A9E6R7F6_9HYPH|nr:23S rRNA (adenine(2030)-N(6))-methyltransferase RlmJ [Chenggangzhangella methanolivorans]QZN99229.1 23S rRNA (adenine(2030)-N(6))-methyltransferase RlmJ [Chenggangzhangella methanolivorans]
MNYRHAFHAGNFADVLKHVVLAKIVAHLNLKDAPWSYLDTHAGVGIYDLSGEEAERTGEWRNGVGRLRDKRLGEAAETLLAPWRAVLAELGPTLYPGSPEIVLRLARAGDRLRLCEKHPKDVAALVDVVGRDRRAKVTEIDGWTALGAWLPPRERRGLVLVDPPFEETGEHGRMAEAFLKAHRIWPTGTYALWRPIKDQRADAAFLKPLAEAGVPKLLDVRLLVRAARDPKTLAGSGLVIANPPWTLADELTAGLPEIARALAQAEGAEAQIEALSV